MKKTHHPEIKVAYVLSYKSPGYIRTKFLLQSISVVPGAKLFTAINSQTNLLRYIETIAKLIWLRISKRPDIYLLGFRGVEIYWLVRLITWGKPLVYDEFINPYLWAVEEHQRIKPSGLAAKLLRAYTGWILRSADRVLSDTKLHARYSSQRFRQPAEKFLPFYVGTDETLFKPLPKPASQTKELQVFFYGTFLPLHGVDFIVEAAKRLASLPIKFTIIGGSARKADMSRFKEGIARAGLQNIDHLPWVDTNQLPAMIAAADVCLGGPFGKTVQAEHVITGKTFQFIAMAKPVIVGRIDEAVGFIDKPNCLLVDQADAIDLADTIEWCYQNKDKLVAIGAKGRKLYEDKFSMAAQSTKIEELVYGFSA